MSPGSLTVAPPRGSGRRHRLAPADAPGRSTAPAPDRTPGRPRIWTEEHVRGQLALFLEGRREWPRAADFAAAGQSVLRRMVARYGGARRWAEEFGVAYRVRQGRPPPAWDEARVRRELGEFLDGCSYWPAAGEFERAGRMALWKAVKRFGGSERWALEFGLPRRTRRAGPRRTWSEERIESELRRFLAGRTEWPTVREFQEAGRASLFTALYTYGGSDHWARRMGLDRRHPARTTRYWTPARIHAQLADFCAGRQTWPTAPDFRAAGRMPLYWAATRHGGLRWWREQLGFGETAAGRLRQVA
jgi:hypothetical protein